MQPPIIRPSRRRIPMSRSSRPRPAFERLLRVDVVRFRHRLFSGELERRARLRRRAPRRGGGDRALRPRPRRASCWSSSSACRRSCRLLAVADRSGGRAGRQPARSYEAVAGARRSEEAGLDADRRADPDPALSADAAAARTRRCCCSAAASTSSSRRRHARPGRGARRHPRRRQDPGRDRGDARCRRRSKAATR